MKRKPVHVAYVEQPDDSTYIVATCSESMQKSYACTEFDRRGQDLDLWKRRGEPDRAIDRAVHRLNEVCLARHVHPRSQS